MTAETYSAAGNGGLLLPTGYLSTIGGQVVGQAGNAVRIASIGWAGSDGPAGSQLNNLAGVSYQAIVNSAKSDGFNTIRIAWSDVSLNAVPTNLGDGSGYGINFTKNPDLSGLTNLQIYQKIVAYAGTIGMKIIFDHHTDDGSGGQQPNGLWIDSGPGTNNTDGAGHAGTITEAKFEADWQQIATAFAGNSTVIGFDLDNEPQLGPTNWGQGGPTDIQAMYTRVGNQLQAIDPGALIIAEGPINYNSSVDGMDLSFVATKPVVLNQPNKVLYSVHEYPTEISGIRHDSGTAYIQNMNQRWGYLISQNIAPVWIGEMGANMTTSDSQSWAATITAYMNGQDGALGGPTVSGNQQPVGGDWWFLGTVLGSLPQGIQISPGTTQYRPEQQAITNQLLFTTPVAQASQTSSTSSSSSSGSGSSSGSSSSGSSPAGSGSSSSAPQSGSLPATPLPVTGAIIPNATMVITANSSVGTVTATAPGELLVPGTGTHVLVGAGGNTTYRFAQGDGHDIIANFQAGATNGDTLQLIGLSSSSVTTSDFHLADTLFDFRNGQGYIYQTTNLGTSFVGAGLIGQINTGVTIGGIGDYNGDGKSDVLYLPTAGSGASAYVQFMNGGTATGALTLGAGIPGKAWVGDFDGDGLSDTLFDFGNGQGYLYKTTSGGASFAGAGLIGAPNEGVQIAGVGDYNGDGNTDILFTPAPGSYAGAYVWFMNGNQVIGSLSLGGGVPGKAWIGDFNGDGKADTLFDFGNGQSYLYLTNSTATGYIGGGLIGTAGSGVHITAVGDFNGDGKADILWAPNAGSTSPSYVWFMNGSSVIGTLSLGSGVPGTAWAGDFNLDGTTVGTPNGTVTLSGVDRRTLTTNNIVAVSATDDYSGQTSGVTVNLVSGVTTVTGDSLYGIANLNGSPYNDTLTGNAGSNVLAGGGGTNTLTGNGGNDTYQFAATDQLDTIVNGVPASNAAAGTLLAAFNHTQLWFAQSGNDLLVDVLGTTQQAVAKNWFTAGNAYAQLAKVTASGDSYTADTGIGTLIQAMASFSAANPAFNPQATSAAMPADATLQAALAANWHH